jgi:hypothetical protein
MALGLSSCASQYAQPSHQAGPPASQAPKQSASAKTLAEVRAEDKRQRLARVGLQPIETTAGEGSEIRRSTYFLWPLSAASVTFSRIPDGGSRVRIAARSTSLEAPVPDAIWAEVVSNDTAAFAPHRSQDAPVGGGFCHGLEVTIEAASNGSFRRQEGHSCGAAASGATLDYAAQLARIAVDAIPACQAARQKESRPINALFDCLGRDAR